MFFSIFFDFSLSGFGEASPEAKGAQNLHHFFTYVAVRIVIAQLEVPLFFLAFLLLCFGGFFYLLRIAN